MGWLNKLLPPKIKRNDTGVARKSSLPEGLWSKCPACEAVLYATDLANNCNVCPKCGHHKRLEARARIDLLLDAEGRSEIAAEVLPVDSLSFKDSRRYPERLRDATEATGETDALVVVRGSIRTLAGRHRCFRVRLHGRLDGVSAWRALRARGAGGGRVRLAFHLCHRFGRCAHAGRSVLADADGQDDGDLTRLSQAKLPFISILTDPTMGGVSASFAFIGDVVIAEPGALIGFAGPRVIEQTVRETLPEGFQRSEFLLEKGAIDMIVDRREMKDRVAGLLTLLQKRSVTQ
jgi:acetyl-CoA carboxylase carboxyl transferase subunit beta